MRRILLALLCMMSLAVCGCTSGDNTVSNIQAQAISTGSVVVTLDAQTAADGTITNVVVSGFDANGKITFSTQLPKTSPLNLVGVPSQTTLLQFLYQNGVVPISVATGSVTIAVGGSTNVTAGTPTSFSGIKSITVTPASANFALGTSQAFTATGLFADNVNRDITSLVTWTSANTTIANISNTAPTRGTANGLAVGVTNVTATFANVTASAQANVTGATLKSLQVLPQSPSLPIGLQQGFGVNGTFSDNTVQNLTTQATWSSATASVANVNAATGLSGGLSAGQTVITATFGGLSGSSTLTVTSAQLQNITVTPSNGSFAKGTSQAFTATGGFSDGVNRDLTSQVVWGSGNAATITLSNTAPTRGLGTGVAVGTTNVTATVNNVTGSTQATVTAATLKSLAVSPQSPSLPLGLQQGFGVNGTFSDNTVQNLTNQAAWSSSNATVANVNAGTGLTTGLAAGQTAITATFSGQSANGTLTVTSAQLQSLTVTPLSASFALGTSQAYTATGAFSDGVSRDLTSQVVWTSNAPATVGISNTAPTRGQASGLAVGATNVTASLNNITAAANATVTAATLKSLQLFPQSPAVPRALQQAFGVNGTFSDNTVQNVTAQVTFGSGTATVANINAAGLSTAQNVGQSLITASLNGQTTNTTMTVTSAVLQNITITPPNSSFAALTTKQYTATGGFSDSSTLDLTSQVTWTSSDAAVTTIGANTGLATGVNAGACNVSASLSGITNQTTATVTPGFLFGNYGFTGTGWLDIFTGVTMAANITFDGNGKITGGVIRREVSSLFGGAGPRVDTITGGTYTLDANRQLLGTITTTVGSYNLVGSVSLDSGQVVTASLNGTGLLAWINGVKKPTAANLASLNGVYQFQFARSYSGFYFGNLTFDGAGNIVGSITHSAFGVVTAATVIAPSTYTVAADGTVALNLTTDIAVANANPLAMLGWVGVENTLVLEANFDGVNTPSPIAGVAAIQAATAATTDFPQGTAGGTIGISLMVSEPGFLGTEPVKPGVIAGSIQSNAAGNVTGGTLTYRDPGGYVALPVNVTTGFIIINGNGTSNGNVTFNFNSPLNGLSTATIEVTAGLPGSIHNPKNAASNVFDIPQGILNPGRGAMMMMP